MIIKIVATIFYFVILVPIDKILDAFGRFGDYLDKWDEKRGIERTF